jgi:hypothetical protein
MLHGRQRSLTKHQHIKVTPPRLIITECNRTVHNHNDLVTNNRSYLTHKRINL